MASQKVKKIAFFGIGNQEKETIKYLQKTEWLQVVKKATKENSRSKDEVSTLIKKADILLTLLEKKAKESLFEKMNPNYISAVDFFSSQEKDFEANRIFLESAWDLIQEKEGALSAIEEKKNLLKELKPWKKVNFSLSNLSEGTYTKTLLGKMPSRFYKEGLNSFLKETETYVFYEESDNVYFSLIFLKSSAETLLEVLKNNSFEEYLPPENCDNLSEESSKIEKEIQTLENTIANTNKILQEYTSDLQCLRMFYDYLVNIKEKEEVENLAVHHGKYTFSFEAWIPEKKLKNLDALLQKRPELGYDIIEPEKGEEPPVFMDNNSFSKPFEFVTGMYSYPGKGEVDPTPFLAPFFAIFLAFCVLDAGYAFVLFGVATLSIKKFRLGESMKQLMKVIRISGALGIVVGVLTGGIFGINYDILPAGAKNFLESIQILEIDPTNSSSLYTLLAICLGMGYVHVLTGFFISFIYKLKAREVLPAFLDVLPWIFMMVGALGALESFLFGALTFLGKSLIGLALLGAAMVLFLNDRVSKNPVIRFFNGLYALYGVSGVFGDILSYARIFALGLSGGIIASVINNLSSMLIVIDFANVGGIIVSILTIILFLAVLIFGHVFMILMSALGAFIHTMRLQFVEFFGKFFEGGGELFNPFKLKMKYFTIKNKK